MSNKVTTCERTFAMEKIRYKVDSNGLWQYLFWRWYMEGHHSSEYTWKHIKRSRVPDEVLKQAES